MANLIFTKKTKTLAALSNSLKFLNNLSLPIAPSVIVPEYKYGDDIPKNVLAPSEFYYLRLYFYEATEKKSEWRIVSAKDLETAARELGTISENNRADLLMQPFCVATYSGAILKSGNIIFLECAYGIAQTLLHLGRFSFRAILVDERVVNIETADQEQAIVWRDDSPTVIKESGWDKYDPTYLIGQLPELLVNTDEILLEWGMVNGSVIFFDHKDIDIVDSYVELAHWPPQIPRSVTATMPIAQSYSQDRTLFLQYPELSQLQNARAKDCIVIEKGALLSHLSVYSLYEHYSCVFL